MTLPDAVNEYYRCFRAAPWFVAVAADLVSPAVVVHTRGRVSRPIDRLVNFENWPLRYVTEPAAKLEPTPTPAEAASIFETWRAAYDSVLAPPAVVRA